MPRLTHGVDEVVDVTSAFHQPSKYIIREAERLQFVIALPSRLEELANR